MIVEFCSRFQTREQCVRFVGYIAVYRFCIPLAILHFLLMLFTVTNTDSQSWRGKLHNGFWLWKCAFIIGLWIISIFIPALEKATVGRMVIIIINTQYDSLDVAGRSGRNCFHLPTKCLSHRLRL
ncbi:unnamed protein product [Rodentolepis nana]|uniref:Serine incorporator 5 n=1 Tax=Rodentolepis nana TaxID=102285 RepID=A0A0R3TKF6_RODNA|nr:unnamed protein product [Rodentolepis nana]